jgi:hypothetical protein
MTGNFHEPVDDVIDNCSVIWINECNVIACTFIVE